MILVDTSIWIDHLRASDATLVALLSSDEVGSHELIIEELALGSIKDREAVLGLLADLVAFPILDHAELLSLVERRRLWGRGLSAIDAHLVGSVALMPGASLWTCDKRLKSAADDIGVGTNS